MHPKLEQAKNMEKLARQIRDEVEEEGREVAKTLVPEYEYNVLVKVKEDNFWTSKILTGQEYIRINRTIVNNHIFDDHLKYYGSITNKPEKSVSSVAYYRKHGILFHDGGGYLLLNDEQPCSDEEWENLKNGVLGKFIK